jgi:hypothetical protein
MNTNQIKYITEIPSVLMDDTITEYMGYDPQKGTSEPVIMKKEGNLWIHASVYGFLEENELMDELMDYFAEHKSFREIIVFDDENQSVIRLDY